MNTLESAITASPYGVSEECALFTIDTTSNPFVFFNIASIGSQYTLTFWAKSTSSKSLTVAGTTISVTNKWERHSVTFTADSVNVALQFQTTGSYYIYHAKLEQGNVPSDWTPAPEDIGASFDAVNQDIRITRESIAQVTMDAEGVKETLSKTETMVSGVSDEVQIARQEILEIQKTTTQFSIGLQKVFDNGVDKVTTTTGFTFNEKGMTISKSDSDVSTQITEDGMTVSEFDEDLLTANHNGVEAKDLHARTFLIVGGRSRFENYGYDRTGCFWISEE